MAFSLNFICSAWYMINSQFFSCSLFILYEMCFPFDINDYSNINDNIYYWSINTNSNFYLDVSIYNYIDIIRKSERILAILGRLVWCKREREFCTILMITIGWTQNTSFSLLTFTVSIVVYVTWFRNLSNSTTFRGITRWRISVAAYSLPRFSSQRANIQRRKEFC